MKIRFLVITALVYGLVVAAWVAPGPVYGQTPPKAIVLAWDGAVPGFVREMLAQGKLPNLAKLIEGGAFADDVTAVFPSSTAPGFASLLTGAPPRITGISGNRVPRTPRSQFTILESSAGFNTALLRAEPVWATAERAGRKVVVAHVPLGGETSELGVHLQGYGGIAGREGIVNERTSEPQVAVSWENLPASAAPPLEPSSATEPASFTIKERSARPCRMAAMEAPKLVIWKQLFWCSISSWKLIAGRSSIFAGNFFSPTPLTRTKRSTCGGAFLIRAFPVCARK